MPIYEYQCKACGHDFDVLQKVSDGALRKCPACGALKLQRLVSAPQFRLKGTGWYETDFKKDGRKRVVESGDAKVTADKDGAGKADTAGNGDATEKKPVKPEKTSPPPSASAN